MSYCTCLNTSLPHPAEDFAAEVLLVRVPPGHDAARGGKDVDSHAAQHARDIGLADVYPATGTRDAFDRRDHRRIAGTVLQVDLDSALGAFFRHLEVGDVRSEEHTSELQSLRHLVC